MLLKTDDNFAESGCLAKRTLIKNFAIVSGYISDR